MPMMMMMMALPGLHLVDVYPRAYASLAYKSYILPKIIASQAQKITKNPNVWLINRQLLLPTSCKSIYCSIFSQMERMDATFFETMPQRMECETKKKKQETTTKMNKIIKRDS